MDYKYKQEIAIENNIISNFFDDELDISKLADFFSFYNKLKDYHLIFGNYESYKSFIHSIKEKHSYFQSYEDILLNNIQFKPSLVADFNSNVQKTKDKIGLSDSIISGDSNSIIYSSKDFINNSFDHRCKLFRIPKNIVIKPNTNLGNLEILNPFLRNAELVEIMDPYFFKDTKKDNLIYIRLLNILLEKCNNAKEIIIHFYNDNDTLTQFNFWKNSLNKKFQKIKVDASKYNVNQNHDRYIVIDSNSYTITTTTSWNNVIINNGDFYSHKGFQLPIEEGRIYVDFS